MMAQLDNVTVDKTFTTFNLWVIFDEILNIKIKVFCFLASYNANTE